MALPAQERMLKVAGARAALLVGRNYEAMDTLSDAMLPRPMCGLMARHRSCEGQTLMP
ncbi:MAG TPA: hypothetical protein VI542_33400 [Candidatus Tectomicrobia bacterium]